MIQENLLQLIYILPKKTEHNVKVVDYQCSFQKKRNEPRLPNNKAFYKGN